MDKPEILSAEEICKCATCQYKGWKDSPCLYCKTEGAFFEVTTAIEQSKQFYEARIAEISKELLAEIEKFPYQQYDEAGDKTEDNTLATYRVYFVGSTSLEQLKQKYGG